MRNEAEMMEGILGFAKGDNRIRAVIMNGSRANPNAPEDLFQDYDIVYVVRELDSFTRDHTWIDLFGDRAMVQMPEIMRDPMGDGRFTYLILLADGNRIDLTLLPLELELVSRDSESILLLDKDGIMEPFAPACDVDYWVKPPEETDFFSCCNNFWWCMQNVAKGIWRDELPYAMGMLDHVREELYCVLEWYIGMENGFAVSAGKTGKYFKRYLPRELYAGYIGTWCVGDECQMWEAVFVLCGLFGKVALAVAEKTGLPYNYAEESNMLGYLRRVRELPHGAKTM